MESDRTEVEGSESPEPLEVLEAAGPAFFTDAQLLERFVSFQDGSAFADLVRRHQNLVMGICLRILHNTQAAEDAFQETFHTLARRARSIRAPNSLAGWLHRVASNAALQIRMSNQRRSARESLAGVQDIAPPADAEAFHLALRVDETLNELPDKYRLPLILCYLDGLTNESAAERLRQPKGSMSTLLARGLDLLRAGLRQKGVTASGVLVAAALATPAQAVAPPLVAAVLQSLPAAVGWTLAGQVKAAVVAALIAAGAVGTGLLSPPPDGPAPEDVGNTPAIQGPAAVSRPVPFSIPDPSTLRPRVQGALPTADTAAPEEAPGAPNNEAGPPAPDALPPLPDLPATASEKAQAALQHALERREERGPGSPKSAPPTSSHGNGPGAKPPHVPPGLEQAREAGRSASAAAEQAQQAVQQSRGRSGK